MNFRNLGLNVIAPYLVLLLGFFTYFFNYEKPPHLFWDENYYVTAVEKYKKNIFFQESHPPLGKLLMAAGDALINPNPGMYLNFHDTDFAKDIPAGYSFRGVRFFPAFFAWINCLMFFFLLMALTSNATWSLCLSFLYATDNALIVHSRGAMLESIQIFGILLALVAFFRIAKSGRIQKRWIATLAFGIAWATWTKLNGSIAVLLLPALLLIPQSEKSIKERFRKLLPYWGVALGVLFAVSLVVWQTHFSLGKSINPSLSNSGWYKASPALKEIKSNPNNDTNFVSSFYIELRDYLNYGTNYARGVPKLNLCKVGENGSPWYFWPFGGKAINYRWETKNKGVTTSYLYLVVNPVSWGLGFLALLFTFSYFLIRYTLGGVDIKKENEWPLMILGLLWLAYMLAITRLDRVMYLYHYFIPLILSYAMLAKWLPLFVERIQFKNFPYKENAAQILLMLCLTAAWGFYSPLTYYLPVSCQGFAKRSLFSFWQMKPIQCPNFKDTSNFVPLPAPEPNFQNPKSVTGPGKVPPSAFNPGLVLPGGAMKRPNQPGAASPSPKLKGSPQPRTTKSLPSKPQR